MADILQVDPGSFPAHTSTFIWYYFIHVCLNSKTIFLISWRKIDINTLTPPLSLSLNMSWYYSYLMTTANDLQWITSLSICNYWCPCSPIHVCYTHINSFVQTWTLGRKRWKASAREHAKSVWLNRWQKLFKY